MKIFKAAAAGLAAISMLINTAGVSAADTGSLPEISVSPGRSAIGKNINLINSTEGDSYSVIETVDGVICRKISTTKQYMYFKVKHKYISENDNNVSAFITYLDDEEGSFVFQYNSSDKSLKNKAYKNAVVEKSGSGVWKTAQIDLHDASFSGAQNFGADFRIYSGDSSDEYISEIKLIKNYNLEYEEAKLDSAEVGNIFEPGKAELYVDIYQGNRGDSAEYSVSYSINSLTSDKRKEFQPVWVTVRKNTSERAIVDLKSITENSVYEIEISVKYKDEEVANFETRFAVMPYYKGSFADSCGRLAVNTHYQEYLEKFADVIDIMEKAGVKCVRDNYNWISYERSKNTFQDSALAAMLNPLRNAGIRFYNLFGTTNPIYYSKDVIEKYGSASGLGPITKEMIDSAINYYRHFLTNNPDVLITDLYNEPDVPSFWRPERDAVMLGQAIKEVCLTLEDEFPNVTVTPNLAGSHYNGDFTREVFETGIYSYIDGFSHHPYEPHKDPQQNYENYVLENGEDMLIENGGWKGSYLSETGYPLTHSGKHSTEQQQSDYYLKSFILGLAADQKFMIYYEFIDSGNDSNNSEHTFGIVRNDTTPKPAYLTYRQMSELFDSSMYLGKINLSEKTVAYAFLKGGKVNAALWSSEAEKADFGQTLTLSDRYGNPLGSFSEFEMTTEPIIATSAGTAFATRAVKETVSNMCDEWIEKYGEKSGHTERVRELKAMAKEIEISKPETLEAAIDKAYSCGLDIINGYENDNAAYTWQEMSYSLYLLHRMGEVMSALAATNPALYGKEVNTYAYRAAEEKVNAAVGEGKLVTTQAILSTAKSYRTLASKINETETSSAKQGVIKANNLMCEKLSLWSEALCGKEKNDELYRVLLHINPTKLSIYSSRMSEKMTVNISSHRKSDISGTFEVYDENNNAVSGTKREINLKAGETYKLETTVIRKGIKENLECEYTARFTDKKGNTSEIKFPVSLRASYEVDAELGISQKPVKEMNSIQVNLKNKEANPIDVKLTVTPPLGWKMSENVKTVKVGAKSSLNVDFGVDIAKRKAFNQYVFHVKAEDEKGNVIYEKDLPLSFSVVVRADDNNELTESDINDWSSAYPIYLNSPENVTDINEWEKQNCSARIFTKWDNENLYILADVYDDKHVQMNSGGDLWNDDSIQISLDTKNSKSSVYDSDDYEIVYGLNPAAEQAAAGYILQAAAEGKTGNVSADNIKILRRDEKCNTRYLIKIPFETVKPLEAVEGHKFGMNFVVNDGDLLYRDAFYELTEGTGGVKCPRLYADWVWSGSETNPVKSVENTEKYIDLH